MPKMTLVNEVVFIAGNERLDEGGRCGMVMMNANADGCLATD